MSENNVSNFLRIFLGCFFGLCCAIFPVSVNAAYTWDDANTDLRALKRDVDRNYRDMVRRSRGVTVTQSGNIVGEVAPNNTMTASTPVRYSSPKLSANSSSVLRYGTNAVKAGAAACLKAPVRCNLVGLGVGLGIDALLDSIDAVIDGNNIGAPVTSQTSADDLGLYNPDTIAEDSFNEYFFPEVSNPSGIQWTNQQYSYGGGLPSNAPSNAFLVEIWTRSNDSRVYYEYCPFSSSQPLVGYKRSNRQCQYGSGEQFVPTYNVPDSVIDSLSEDFQLTDSDLPTVGTVVMSFEPTTIELAPTQPEKISDWSHFNNDGTYSELDLSAYFGVGDSPSASPSVEFVEETTKKDFDEFGNLVNEETTVERDSPIPNASQPSSSVDLDIPTGCDLFDPFCKWAEWTQQDLGEEEPDLSVLINDFESDDDAYSIDLGSAVCPDPISINIAFLNTDLELSYEPACDLMTMIRPLILASAYLLAAYIYLGVFRG